MDTGRSGWFTIRQYDKTRSPAKEMAGLRTDSGVLERNSRRELQLARCVLRRSTHAARLDGFRAVRCTRIVIPLHIERVERIKIDSEAHSLGDGEHLEE